ncbi:MAG: hypothetical protein IMY79_00515 [Chloroflexi bacterium]|nr:hypothetical protein [Chloroflexota bacterium]
MLQRLGTEILRDKAGAELHPGLTVRGMIGHTICYNPGTCHDNGAPHSMTSGGTNLGRIAATKA